MSFAVAGNLLLDAVHYYRTGHRELLTAAARPEVPFLPSQIDPTWITEGKPTFHMQVYADLKDAQAFAGTWECTGPAKFRWEYTVDESIYVLAGYAEVEHAGAVQHLHPGSVVFFPSGSVAKWNVPEHIEKTFVISNPGRLKRLERRLLFSYPNQ